MPRLAGATLDGIVGDGSRGGAWAGAWVRLAALAALLAGCGVDGSSFDFDGDGVIDSQDCGPDRADVHPGAEDPYGDGLDADCDGIDGRDFDGDGYPADAAAPAGVRDCDDAQAQVHPGGIEVPGNALDEDCDGVLDSDGDGTDDGDDCAPEDPLLDGEDHDGDGQTSCDGDCDDRDPSRDTLDRDGDGVDRCGGDCDDEDPAATPGATEVCDGSDNDCDGALPADEADADQDGQRPCAGDCDDLDADRTGLDVDGDGQTSCAGDCDDGDAAVSSAEVEVCDGRDTDCDGDVPVDEQDQDGDGQAACAGDCADLDAGRDGIDDDGDGQTECGVGAAWDCDDGDAAAVSRDDDGDGVAVCGAAGPGEDCDDGSAAVFPGAVEVCDGVDSDCDGLLPEGERDLDGDGQGACAGDCDDLDPTIDGADSDGDGVSSCSGDCDDGDAAVLPLATEDACDGIDSDCVLDPGEVDGDGDGSLPCGDDCDDGDPARAPGQPERCNGLDDDCDGVVPSDPEGGPLSEVDNDGDGWVACSGWTGVNPSVLGGGDCGPQEADRYPGAQDVCDGADNDCNGVVDDTRDLDGDGMEPCEGDCDDLDAAVYLGRWEAAGDGLDSDCDGSDYSLGELTGWDVLDPLAVPEGRGGQAFDSVGDLDGDGIGDIAVGAFEQGDQEVVALVSGTAAFGAAPPFSGLGSLVHDDPSYTRFGWAMTHPGDLDGDGDGELVVGAELDDVAGDDAGAVWVFSLGSLRDPGGVWSGGALGTDQAVAVIRGADPGDRLGAHVDRVDDLTGDGVPDLLISQGRREVDQPPDSFVFDGALVAQGGAFVAPTDAWLHVVGSSRQRGGGRLGAADLDGDGVPDLFTTDTFDSQYISIFKGSSLSAGTVSTASASLALLRPEDFSYPRGDALRTYQTHAQAVPDLDGDGRDELWVASPNSSLFGERRGVAFLVRGAGLVDGAGSLLSGDQPLLQLQSAALFGVVTQQYLGEAPCVCDVDGDGVSDLLAMSVDSYEAPGLYAGVVWIVDGAAAVGTINSSQATYALSGSNSRSQDASLGCLGDLDGDGVMEWGSQVGRRDFGATGLRLWSGSP